MTRLVFISFPFSLETSRIIIGDYKKQVASFVQDTMKKKNHLISITYLLWLKMDSFKFKPIVKFLSILIITFRNSDTTITVVFFIQN